jgi:2-C-methyl-D-erythritol 2,4-cyclodiphosphate synthase
MRIGQGFDLHPLRAGYPLRLGGVTIPADRGAVGDSDGDVLLHAVMDAVLGAAGLGDLGQYFTSADVVPGTASTALWQRLQPLVEATGLRLVSLDSTVVLESPRLSPYREAIVRSLMDLTGAEHVSVKFKSADGLGVIGAGEAVAAMAVVLMASPA